ncbi:NmrA/HSCARG family protein [Streptomyces sp. NBC_01341]|uniref:NmrA/HSCARG family protein n=1 Tax=Streptomyces sp. NBC_01341 TaxID=2903831 RepID=UPI002E1129AF|nr:NmrA/HSCARG family protein [Streptomyces sp. NBC_01341]
MEIKKIIAVVGATGKQGGGLVDAVLADPDSPFVVRALTRDSSSRAAEDLVARGVEVVEADLDSESSLAQAFAGAHGAFVVTDFWSPLTPEQEAARPRPVREFEQAANAARAAKAAGVSHVVWSTLEDTRPHFEGTGDTVPRVEGGYTAPHFDVKAQADAIFAELQVPTTYLRLPFFYETLFLGMGPVRNPRGELVLSIPIADRKMTVIGAQDIGRTVHLIFKSAGDWIGKTVSIAAEHVTGEQLAEMLSAAVGEKVTYQPYSWPEFRGLPIPHAVAVANGLQFLAERSDDTELRDIELTHNLNPQLESYETWIGKNRAALRALNA